MLHFKWARGFGSVLLTLFFLTIGARGANFDIRQTTNPSSPAVGSNLVFLTEVVQQIPFFANGITVTNVFSPSLTIVSATSSNGSAAINGNTVIFQSNPSGAGVTNLISIVTTPSAAGLVSNVVTAVALGVPAETTNFVTAISGAGGSGADLGVFVRGPSSSPVLGDPVNYTIIATNAGPASATGVVITNTFSSGVTLLSASPTNSSFDGHVLTFNVGTLASGSGSSFSVSVQPTASGTLTSTAVISAPGNTDTNAVNNSSPFVTTIVGIDTVLVVTNVSDMVFNRQNGLMEQTIQLLNTTGSNVPAARVVLSNFNFRVFNAVGTNNGAPYVVCQSAIPAGGPPVPLVLEYFIRERTAVPNPDFFAFGVPAVSATAATNGVDATIKSTTDGRMMIEFASEPGQSYRILYSDSVTFTNALFAQPDIIAPANRTQWIDSGPPKTVSVPTSARFYRVLKGQ